MSDQANRGDYGAAQQYRKKPVVIEAMRLTADNAKDVCDWVHSAIVRRDGTETIGYLNDGVVVISTLEGDMRADVGDYVIRGVQGEHYPCKPDIFEATYEPVDPGEPSGGVG